MMRPLLLQFQSKLLFILLLEFNAKFKISISPHCSGLPEGIINDSPEADALLTTALERCLLPGTAGGATTLPTGDNSLLFSEDDVPVSKPLWSSSTEMENFGSMSRCTIFLFLCI